METFDWIAAGIVVASLVYISFVPTLADWFSLLRKGQAVTLLPERQGRTWPVWTQVVIVIFSLGLFVPFFYHGWIPLVPLSTATARMLDVAGLVIYLLGLVNEAGEVAGKIKKVFRDKGGEIISHKLHSPFEYLSTLASEMNGNGGEEGDRSRWVSESTPGQTRTVLSGSGGRRSVH